MTTEIIEEKTNDNIPLHNASPEMKIEYERANAFNQKIHQIEQDRINSELFYAKRVAEQEVVINNLIERLVKAETLLQTRAGESVHLRVQKVRADLMKVQKAKSGKNNFIGKGFDYMQLEDFLPELTSISLEHGISDEITFDVERNLAILTIYNCYNSDDTMRFYAPLEMATANKQQEIQNVGATITYYRRYLYMLAYNIVVTDAVDSVETSKMLAEQQENNKRTTRATKKQAKKIDKKELIENITKHIPEANIQKFLANKGVESLENVSEGELQAAWNAYSQNMQN